MSAAQPKPSDTKAADPKQAAEPSMEEILASIRKIISDDQAPPPEPEPEPVAFTPPPEPEPPAPPPAAEEDDVLDLASMMVPQPEPEPAPAPALADDLDFLPESLAPEPPPPPPPVAPPPPPPRPVFLEPPASPEALLSQGPNEAVTQAFGSLSHMIMSQNRTLDDLVKELLRPMLRSWLDDNLPSLVERLVKAEIERVARGGR